MVSPAAKDGALYSRFGMRIDLRNINPQNTVFFLSPTTIHKTSCLW